jgi:hypothetical protein
LFASAEHGHGHEHHGTGVRWLDIIAAVSVIFISVLSLVVSIEHGRTMEKMVQQNEKMVAANTMPFLSFGGSMIDPVNNTPKLRLILKNGGVGPAVIDSFELRYKGVAYAPNTMNDLMHACCAAALSQRKVPQDSGITYSNASQTILPARESLEILVVPSQAGQELYTALNQAREDMSVRACYCSVLDECWQTDFGSSRPTPVKECHTPPNAVLW